MSDHLSRRQFLRGALIGAAVLAPSQVWPFRKIFLPSWRDLLQILNPLVPETFTWNNLARSPYPGPLRSPLTIDQIEALELEQFAKEIPQLVFHEMPIYRYIKSKRTIEVSTREINETLRIFKKDLDEAAGGDDVDRLLQKSLREVTRETVRGLKSGNFLLVPESDKGHS